MSYWDAYMLPVPIRKYFIKKFNERTKSPDNDKDYKPLPQSEKMKYIKQNNAEPGQLKDMFSSRRNS